MRVFRAALLIAVGAVVLAGCGDDEPAAPSGSDRAAREYLEAVGDRDWKRACALYTPGRAKAFEGSPTRPGGTCERSEGSAAAMAVQQGLRFRLGDKAGEAELEAEQDGDRAEVSVKGDEAVRLELQKVDGRWLVDEASGLYARD